MTELRDAALGLEVVKIAMSQNKDGVKVTFVIHPNDDAADLYAHPVGSRYQMALVLVDDEGAPVKPKSRTAGENAVQAAAMLCQQAEFQKWVATQTFHPDKREIVSEEEAIQFVYRICGISSRAELKSDREALRKFDELRLEFSKSRGL